MTYCGWREVPRTPVLALRVDRPMPDPSHRFLGKSGDVRRIGPAFALSVLVHAAALAVLAPRLPGRAPWPGQAHEATKVLEVGFANRVAASAAPVDARAIRGAQRAPAPARTVPAAPRAARRTVAEDAPPVPADARETPLLLAAPIPQAADRTAYAPAPGPEWWRPTSGALAEARAAPTVGGDLSSAVTARRRERAELTAPKAGSGHDRVVASSMPAPQSPVDDERRYRGGIFAITRMGYDDAEFLFFGWNNDAHRQPAQAIDVRLGANQDMRIAVVRRMIALIREHEQADFQWQSWRLGRVVLLSARPEDNVRLEDFLLREFFGTTAPVEPR